MSATARPVTPTDDGDANAPAPIAAATPPTSALREREGASPASLACSCSCCALNTVVVAPAADPRRNANRAAAHDVVVIGSGGAFDWTLPHRTRDMAAGKDDGQHCVVCGRSSAPTYQEILMAR